MMAVKRNRPGVLSAWLLALAPQVVASPDLKWTMEAIRHVTPASTLDAPTAHLDYVKSPEHDWKFHRFLNAQTSERGEIYAARFENNQVSRRAVEKAIGSRPMVIRTEHDPVSVDFIVATKSVVFVQDGDVAFTLQFKPTIAANLRDAIVKETVAVVKQARAAVDDKRAKAVSSPQLTQSDPGSQPGRASSQPRASRGTVEPPAKAAPPEQPQSKRTGIKSASREVGWAWILAGLLALVGLLIVASRRSRSATRRRE